MMNTNLGVGSIVFSKTDCEVKDFIVRKVEIEFIGKVKEITPDNSLRCTDYISRAKVFESDSKDPQVFSWGRSNHFIECLKENYGLSIEMEDDDYSYLDIIENSEKRLVEADEFDAFLDNI